METLVRVVCSSFPTTPLAIPHRSLPNRNPSVSALRTSPSPVSELAEEDVLQTFFKERQLNGDFVSRLSDVFWRREFTKFVDADEVGQIDDTTPQQAEEQVVANDAGGFLKLSTTNEWVLGDRSAPINKKAIAKALQNDSERRKKLNLLQYEAGAVSYATGVLFRIGIRSQDLEDFLEKLIKGCGIALSSPRLVLPAAIYGLWILSHQYLSSDLFDFQLVPAMVGLFVYKAAALVQVYRDNEDLQLIFPDEGGL